MNAKTIDELIKMIKTLNAVHDKALDAAIAAVKFQIGELTVCRVVIADIEALKTDNL